MTYEEAEIYMFGYWTGILTVHTDAFVQYPAEKLEKARKHLIKGDDSSRYWEIRDIVQKEIDELKKQRVCILLNTIHSFYTLIVLQTSVALNTLICCRYVCHFSIYLY